VKNFVAVPCAAYLRQGYPVSANNARLAAKRRYPIAATSGIVMQVPGLVLEISAKKQDCRKATLRKIVKGLAIPTHEIQQGEMP
jgi:hypothetical protein